MLASSGGRLIAVVHNEYRCGAYSHCRGGTGAGPLEGTFTAGSRKAEKSIAADGAGRIRTARFKCYHPSMSKGSGRIERRIGELFAATKDRALSVGELASYAFGLADGVLPDRKQRLSATRAAHRLLRRAAAATEAAEVAFDRSVAETAASRARTRRARASRERLFSVGSRFVWMDAAFHDALLVASGGRPISRQSRC